MSCLATDDLADLQKVHTTAKTDRPESDYMPTAVVDCNSSGWRYKHPQCQGAGRQHPKLHTVSSYVWQQHTCCSVVHKSSCTPQGPTHRCKTHNSLHAKQTRNRRLHCLQEQQKTPLPRLARAHQYQAAASASHTDEHMAMQAQRSHIHEDNPRPLAANRCIIEAPQNPVMLPTRRRDHAMHVTTILKPTTKHRWLQLNSSTPAALPHTITPITKLQRNPNSLAARRKHVNRPNLSTLTGQQGCDSAN